MYMCVWTWYKVQVRLHMCMKSMHAFNIIYVYLFVYGICVWYVCRYDCYESQSASQSL